MTALPTPPPATGPVLVRISDATGLLSAAPVLIGFHPTESLVVLAVRGPRCRVGPVMRVDLPKRAAAVEAQSRWLAGSTAVHADRAAIFCYSDASRATAALTTLLHCMDDAGVEVYEAMVVRRDRAEFLPDRRGCRRPPIPLPTADDPVAKELATAGALTGRRVLADRAALARSVAGPAGAALRVGQTATRWAAAEVDRRMLGSDDPTNRAGALFDLAPVALAAAIAEYDECHRVDPATAALLALACTQPTARDGVIASIADDAQGRVVPVLVAAVTVLPDPAVPDLCAVLAFAAYRSGDGGLAQVSLDRCLRAVPAHRLALLFLGLIESAITPEQLGGLSQLGELTRPVGLG